MSESFEVSRPGMSPQEGDAITEGGKEKSGGVNKTKLRRVIEWMHGGVQEHLAAKVETEQQGMKADAAAMQRRIQSEQLEAQLRQAKGEVSQSPANHALVAALANAQEANARMMKTEEAKLAMILTPQMVESLLKMYNETPFPALDIDRWLTDFTRYKKALDIKLSSHVQPDPQLVEMYTKVLEAVMFLERKKV